MQRPIVRFTVRAVALTAVILAIAWTGGYAADHLPPLVTVALFLLAMSWLVTSETKS